MTIYVRPGYNRVLAEEFEALKVKRVGLVKDKVEAHSQGDLRENFGFKAAKEAIRAVDRKMTALDRFVARNTFIEVDPATWLTKPTDTLQLGHVTTLEKQDLPSRRKNVFTFLVTTHGETASDPDSGIECLPHDSPLAKVALGMAAQESREVALPAGEAILTILAIRNPTQAELDRLLSDIKPPQIDQTRPSSGGCRRRARVRTVWHNMQHVAPACGPPRFASRKPRVTLRIHDPKKECG